MSGLASIESLKPASILGAEKPHGTRMRYMSGCKCPECRAANSRYECERARERKAGNSNGIVSAKKARKHILKLSKVGIGYKTIADAAGISPSCIFKIRTGERQNLRAMNEKRILAVDETCVSDATIISGKKMHTQIDWLLGDGGFDEKRLAKALGYQNNFLQFGNRVIASTALKVERFYNSIRFPKPKDSYTVRYQNDCESTATAQGFTRSEAQNCFDFSVGCKNCPLRD